MTTGFQTVVAPVSDVSAAKAFYTALFGAEPYVDQPYYIGYKVGDTEFGLDPHSHKDGLTPYVDVDDIEAQVSAVLAAGGTEKQAINDVGGGLRVAVVADPDGNLIGLRQGS